MSCSDSTAEALFEDEGEDQSLPVCILEALMKVSLVLIHKQ